MYTINFLEKRHKQLSKLERQDRQLLQYVVIGFSVVSVLTLGLLGGRLYFQSQLTQQQTRQQQLETEFVSHQHTEEMFLFYISKLETLEKLFAARADKQAAIEYFSNIFGPEVVIQNINYDAKNANITFGLQAKDVFTLDRVFTALSSDQTKAQFKQVTRSDLRRTSEGMYTIRVIVAFGTNDKT
jgi:Tfp pilus assembly protein PilN